MVCFKKICTTATFIVLFLLFFLACSRTPGKDPVSSYVLAAAAYDAGNIPLARTLAEKILSGDPDFLPALMLAGKTAYFQGDDGFCISRFEHALRIIPRSGAPALWLARAYRAVDRSNDAKSVVEQLLGTDPDNVAALRLSASIALDADDTATAIALLDRAVESAAESGLVHADRAALRWAAGDGAGALADLDAAVSMLPENSEASNAARDIRKRIEDALHDR
jgi:tetratricopeptide (TPR) repeat protein